MVFLRIALIVLLLAGCQSTQNPRYGAVIDDVSAPRIDAESGHAAGAESFSRSGTGVTVRVSGAMQELLQQGRDELQRRLWWQAVDTAERGLRIDRRQPGFYEILAAAYRALGDAQKASAFARQGRRYCDLESPACVRMRQYLGAN